MTNYILCYPPGAGGRFLSATLYHSINNLDKPVLITKENSGHANVLETGFMILNGISQDHAMTFSHLTKIDVPHDTVFCTHAFPPTDLLTKNDIFSNSKLIMISYDEDDFPILLKNKFAKASIPGLIEMINSDTGIESYANKLFYQHQLYILRNFENKYGYNITPTNIHYINTKRDIYAMCSRQFKSNYLTYLFKYPLPVESNDRILTLKYKDIFEKTDTSYVALDKLSKFTGCKILPNILTSYQQYVDGQKKLLEELSYL